VNIRLERLPKVKATRFNDCKVIRAVFMDEGFAELTRDKFFMVETLELNYKE